MEGEKERRGKGRKGERRFVPDHFLTAVAAPGITVIMPVLHAGFLSYSLMIVWLLAVNRAIEYIVYRL